MPLSITIRQILWLSNYNLLSSTIAILDINHLKALLKVNKR